ncbi:tetratricopeptide repeat protein [Deefgea rivuli]|uniref:tetratricopeptide repeat protein n=1 Tax=Deefgea rivuli TaxID=400948 RepID=UPI0006842CB9|nr:tetratricopeptide repeat protein [Deefgea rivuli]
MKIFCFVVIGFTFMLSTTVNAGIDKHIDENGNVSFANNPIKKSTKVVGASSDVNELFSTLKAEDFTRAFEALMPLAQKGDAASQVGIGWMYDNGKGVPQDFANALSWYRKAAEQGEASAINNLAVMYASGRGVPQNKVIAYALFNLAAMDSTTNGSEGRERVLTSMTPKQIAAGQILSREMAKPNNLNKAIAVYLKN